MEEKLDKIVKKGINSSLLHKEVFDGLEITSFRRKHETGYRMIKITGLQFHKDLVVETLITEKSDCIQFEFDPKDWQNGFLNPFVHLFKIDSIEKGKLRLFDVKFRITARESTTVIEVIKNE